MIRTFDGDATSDSVMQCLERHRSRRNGTECDIVMQNGGFIVHEAAPPTGIERSRRNELESIQTTPVVFALETQPLHG